MPMLNLIIAAVQVNGNIYHYEKNKYIKIVFQLGNFTSDGSCISRKCVGKIRLF